MYTFGARLTYERILPDLFKGHALEQYTGQLLHSVVSTIIATASSPCPLADTIKASPGRAAQIFIRRARNSSSTARRTLTKTVYSIVQGERCRIINVLCMGHEFDQQQQEIEDACAIYQHSIRTRVARSHRTGGRSSSYLDDGSGGLSNPGSGTHCHYLRDFRPGRGGGAPFRMVLISHSRSSVLHSPIANSR